MAMDIRETFERGTQTFNAHDIDGFAALMAEDAVFEAPGGMHGEGKAACVEFYGGWLRAFPDARVQIDDVHFAGDVAVEEGTFSGTHQGAIRTPTGEIPPTGRRLSLGYIQVIQYRDGLTTRFHLSFDRLGMLEQLGLAQVPEPAA